MPRTGTVNAVWTPDYQNKFAKAGADSHMSSPTFDTLRDTLEQVRRRRSRRYLTYHLSLISGGFLANLLLFSLVAAWLQPATPVLILLFLCFLGVTAALGWSLVQRLRLLHSDDRQLAHYVEENIPDLEQRLLTSLEFSDADGRDGVSSQFIEQLWHDAREHVQLRREHVDRVAYARNAPLAGAGALLIAVVTAAAFLVSDTLKQSGGQLLWPFARSPEMASLPLETLDVPPEIEIHVEPGDLRLQRGDSVNIIARIVNADPGDVQLRMQSDNLNWRDIDMRRDGGGSDGALYSHYVNALDNELVYYVSFDDGDRRSEQFRISLYDLPRVQQIDVAMNYPEYTGMEPETEQDSGDMVVPEGTEVTLSVAFNKPVREAEIEFDSEAGEYQRLPLAVEGETGTVNFTVSRDAVYRIHAVDFDRMQSEAPLDYYIRAIEDQPPELVLRSPGSDQDVMPLEEVVLEVDARDDYGLTAFTLHYTVIGQEERTVDFLPDDPVRSVTGTEMIYMEDLDVQPGDFVSYYLSVADNNGLSGPQEVVSDIYFLQVISTDAEYRRASGGQQGGGGGAGGAEDSALVTLQKDIIAATWKLRNQAVNMESSQFTDDVSVVADSQRDAIQRARMSIDRLSERLSFADDSYGNAVNHLNLAIDEMQKAAGELDLEQVTSALQPQQQALQYVLRAEAEINRTDVSFQQTAGGGGAGNRQRQEREDLRELFEMEMGRNENRYQTPERAGGSQAQSEEASRLEELARRQEGLTRAQRNLSRRMEDMTEEQRRRELERLRREQEQLTADLDQLSQQLARRQEAQGGQQQNQQSGQQQGQQQAGGQQQAQSQLQRALEQMREASRADTPAQAAARSQRALESMREEQRNLDQQQQQDNSVNQLARNLSQRGQDLVRSQRELQQQLQEASREQGLGQTRQSARSSEQIQDLMTRQQQQRRELEEIERMLRAIVARAGNEEQALMSQAQRASRQVRPIREQMDSSNRVLNNGMVNLSVDIEREVGEELAQLGRALQAMNPGQDRERGSGDESVMQAAREASELREQIEALERRAREFGEDADGPRTVGDMRQQLARSRELAEQLDRRVEQLDQQAQAGGGADNNARDGGNTQRADRRDLGGIPEYGEAGLWGNARSVRSRLSDEDLETFLSQPELLQQLLESLFELESELRARAELEEIERRLYAAADDEVPEQYRRMVEAYYRALSDNRSQADEQQ